MQFMTKPILQFQESDRMLPNLQFQTPISKDVAVVIAAKPAISGM